MTKDEVKIKELKDVVSRRIAFVKQMCEIGKLRMDEPYTKEHWTGYVAALDGEAGELKFLEKLLKAM